MEPGDIAEATADKAIEWIKRAQERIAISPSAESFGLPQSMVDARRFLNEARVLLGDETELAK